MQIAAVYTSPYKWETRMKLSGVIDNMPDHQTVFLCSQPLEKVLKKNIDLDIPALIEKYDIIIPIGAQPFKELCKKTGVTNYNAKLVDNKYIPSIDPNMLIFKPDLKDEVLKIKATIDKVLKGTYKVKVYDKNYEYIDTTARFLEWLPQLEACEQPVVDIETTGLNWLVHNIIGVAFGVIEHSGVYVSHEVVKQFKDKLKTILESKRCIMHNSKFDCKFLYRHYGWQLWKNVDDTMLLHYILDESVGSHGLKELAFKYTDLGDYDAELKAYIAEWCKTNKMKQDAFNYGMIPIEILAEYACKDADGTMQIFNKFMPLVIGNPKFKFVYEKILMPSNSALIKLEMNGGPISVERLVEVKTMYDKDVEDCMYDVYSMPEIKEFEEYQGKEFNPGSVKQLQDLFFNYLKLQPIKKTKSGAFSTDKEVLEVLDHPVAQAISDYRKATKLISTYIDPIFDNIDMDLRIRSGFNLQGTTSGRLSSSQPINLQNLPRDNKDIKKLYCARAGYCIVQADLKTAEVYYAAVLSDDKYLKQAFIDNLDFHSYVAKGIFGLDCAVEDVKKLYPSHRQWAKAITFGINDI